MEAKSLLKELRQRGIDVSELDGKLKVKAKKGTVTAEDKAALQKHKAEIITALREPANDHPAHDIADPETAARLDRAVQYITPEWQVLTPPTHKTPQAPDDNCICGSNQFYHMPGKVDWQCRHCDNADFDNCRDTTVTI